MVLQFKFRWAICQIISGLFCNCKLENFSNNTNYSMRTKRRSSTCVDSQSVLVFCSKICIHLTCNTLFPNCPNKWHSKLRIKANGSIRMGGWRCHMWRFSILFQMLKVRPQRLKNHRLQLIWINKLKMWRNLLNLSSLTRILGLQIRIKTWQTYKIKMSSH